MKDEKGQIVTGNNLSRRNIDDMLTKLKESLSIREDLAFVFLFGSFVTGGRNALSDLDIAVLFRGRVGFEKMCELREDLSETLGIEVDVVVLNSASPVIKMQVLKKGMLLIDNDRRAYNEFFVSTVKEYDDLKRTRREVEDNILRGRIYAR